MNYLKIRQSTIISQFRVQSYVNSSQKLFDTSFTILKTFHKLRYSVLNSKFKTHSYSNHAPSKAEQLQEESSSTKNSSCPAEKIEEPKNIYKIKSKKVSLIVPTLPPSRINEIRTVAGITVGLSHISWMKLSLPNLLVLNWNAKVLPEDFRSKKDEHSILKMAYDINYSLPSADLFVMETFSLKGRQLYEKLNEVHLLSMLTVLLNGIHTDPNWKEKVVFQKKFVLNNLYNLFVGSERVSTRETVENILCNRFYTAETEADVENKNPNVNTSTEISPKHIALYKESNVDKKEDLSLAFLLTLSFVDVNIFQNESSLLKVQSKNHKLK